MEIISRIKEIIRLKAKSVLDFSKTIGVNQVTLNNQIIGNRKLSLETIISITNTYPDISAEWLLREEGDMIRSNNVQDFKNSKDYQEYKKMEDLFIEYNRQTDVLLEDKDRTIRELQLKLARLEAERIVEARIKN